MRPGRRGPLPNRTHRSRSMLMTATQPDARSIAHRFLDGRAAIVTGSTSGIGLGIARAFAGAGAKVMLNGFGDAGEIEKIRAGLADEFQVEIRFDGADM